MRSRGPDIPALVAGLAITAFGMVILLDNLDALELTFASLGPIVCSVAGAILLAVGLSRRS